MARKMSLLFVVVLAMAAVLSVHGQCPPAASLRPIAGASYSSPSQAYLNFRATPLECCNRCRTAPLCRAWSLRVQGNSSTCYLYRNCFPPALSGLRTISAVRRRDPRCLTTPVPAPVAKPPVIPRPTPTVPSGKTPPISPLCSAKPLSRNCPFFVAAPTITVANVQDQVRFRVRWTPEATPRVLIVLNPMPSGLQLINAAPQFTCQAKLSCSASVCLAPNNGGLVVSYENVRSLNLQIKLLGLAGQNITGTLYTTCDQAIPLRARAIAPAGSLGGDPLADPLA